MARRKKEPLNVHRENILFAAQNLFMQNGIEFTSMDNIAKTSGYSKATLYVYFKNKEEIVNLLVLESMKKLYDYICNALEQSENTKKRYDRICNALLKYQSEFPFYFKTVLDEINIDFKNKNFSDAEQETFYTGENINKKIEEFLDNGIKNGDIKSDIKVLPTIFTFWGSLAGIIQLAVNKEKYIKQEMGLSKQEFLSYSFDTLYNSISKKEN